MKQQYCQQLVALWLLLATLFLTACGGEDGPPDEATIKQAVNAANELVYEDQADLAIAKLEELQNQAPDNALVLESLAFAHSKAADPGMAALYFDQAYQLAPENHALALYAAQAHMESGNPEGAAATYQKYLEQNANDAAAWKELGHAQVELNRKQAALNAFLESFRQSREQPTHEEAALIGHLYHSVGNEAQAAKWYLQALRPGGAASDRMTAQLGLFDLALADQDWPRAIELMNQIEQEFPGELDTGPYANARSELIKWQNAQSALSQTTIAQSIDPNAEIPAGEMATEGIGEEVPASTVVQPPAPQTTTSEEDIFAALDNLPAVTDSSVSVTEEATVVEEIPDMTTVEQPAVGPDSTNIADARQDAASETITTTADGSVAVVDEYTSTGPNLGNLNDPNDPATAKMRPSEEMVDLTEEVQGGGTTTTTGEASVEPDDGALAATDIEVEETVTETATLTEDGGMTIQETTAVAIEEVDENGVTETIEEEATETTVAESETPDGGIIAIDLPDPNMTPAERAALAYEAGDYGTAIRFYRQALATGSNAEISYELSRAYYENRQYRESAAFAAEATRLEPNNVRYALNYLRSIQRTVNRDTLMRELVRAKERFPTNPDITLALGRAYEVIMGNTRNARFLYEEFIALAPEHPRADEIRAKLTRMPQ